jgi:hypothetical protein
VVDVEQQYRREAVAAEEESHDDYDFDRSGLGSQEKVAESRWP